MKKLVLVAALATASSAAFASGWGHHGSASGFAGNAVGEIAVSTEGLSVAASQVAGSGFSLQKAEGFAGAEAYIGGSIQSNGAAVWTDSSHWAQTKASGQTFGKNTKAFDAEGAILNGSAAFSQATTASEISGTFAMGKIGGVQSIVPVLPVSAP